MEQQNYAIYKEKGELKWEAFETEQAAPDQLNALEGKPNVDPLLYYNPLSTYSGVPHAEARDIVAEFNKARKEQEG